VTIDLPGVARDSERSVITEDFSGYGRPVTVATPPAAEVTDTTEETAQLVKERLGS